MKTKEIKKQLQTEISEMEVPFVLPNVLMADEKLFKDQKPTKASKPKVLFKVFASALAACLVFLGVFTMLPIMTFDQTVYASVTMDINPSISMDINENNQVISIESFNDDGDELIAKLTFRRRNVDEIVQTLITRAVEKNFIVASENFIYLTIDCQNETAKQTLQNSLQSRIVQAVQNKGMEIGQDEIGFGDIVKEEIGSANNHGISLAKFTFIKQVYENTNNTFETLDAFVEEMKDQSMGYIRAFLIQNHK